MNTDIEPNSEAEDALKQLEVALERIARFKKESHELTNKNEKLTKDNETLFSELQVLRFQVKKLLNLT
jgi:hypothetical protein